MKEVGMIELGMEYMLRYFDSPFLLTRDFDGKLHLMYMPRNKEKNDGNPD